MYLSLATVHFFRINNQKDETALQSTRTCNTAIKSARIIQNLKCACALSHPPHKKDEEVNGVLHS